MVGNRPAGLKSVLLNHYYYKKLNTGRFWKDNLTYYVGLARKPARY